MKSPEDVPTLKYDNIVAAPRGLIESQGGKIITLVPVSEINWVTLRFGRPDQRPVLSLVVGILVSAVGLYGVGGLLLAPDGYRYELAMVTLGLIGAFMIFDTLKKRFYLDVTKKKGCSRLVFSKDAQLPDIQEFCEQVRTVYKHQIAEDLKK
jgi:hypothetical protein